ncbi:hypothetical protein ACSBM8_19250 [Sphingomonas sp. ASY06-1R]|uniref:hypothetical protein n=1 Tax=Sphingomonas sp. ASY06-1R TaxID=3445771 RepID=UPI003FA20E41
MVRAIICWVLPLLIALPGAAPARPASATPIKQGTLPPGPAMIVIAPQYIPPRDRASEAYADWTAYLNDVIAAQPPRLLIVRITPAQWQQRVGRPAVADGYATVFLRRDGTALFHQGMILELDIYRSALAWMTTGQIPDAAARGLTAIRIRPN